MDDYDYNYDSYSDESDGFNYVTEHISESLYEKTVSHKHIFSHMTTEIYDYDNFLYDVTSEETSDGSYNFSEFYFETNETYYEISNDVRFESYIVPIVFAIVFVVGIVGNGLLLVFLRRQRIFNEIPNTYILSLALADLLVIITCVPFYSTVYTVESWPWGEAMCKISETVKDVSIGVSVFTLTALSADRFFAIVDPLRKLHTSGGGKRATRITIIAAILIWVLAMLCAVPAAAATYLREFQVNPTTVIYVCYPFPEEWGPNYPRLMVLLRFLLYYSLPLATIGIFYALMARHLVLSARNVPGELRGAHRQVRARRKVAITVLAFVLIFAICFLPYHVTMMWFYYSPTAQEDYNAFWHIFRIVGFCLSFVNSCVNPVALYCVSGAFRKHFNRYLLCKTGSGRDLSNARRANSLSLTTTRRTISRASNRKNMTTSIRRGGQETSVTTLGNGNIPLNYSNDIICSKM